jgi:hypothetical protein
MLATVGKIVPPASPLSISAAVSGGSVPVDVDAASGSSLALPGGASRIFTAAASGGTSPYTYLWDRQNTGSKTSLDSISGTTAHMSWSGFVVGEYQSVTANCRVTDSDGNTATSNTIVIGVTRTV